MGNAIGMLQYVVPLLLACVLGVAGVAEIEPYEDVWVVRSTIQMPREKLWTGFAYGGFVFTWNNETYSHLNAYQEADEWLLQHEYGHTLQQRILNEWYPLVVIPSLISATTTYKVHCNMPWEIWANQLSGYDPSRRDYFIHKIRREL